MNPSIPNDSNASTGRSFYSFTLRELLLVLVIASLVILYFVRPASPTAPKSNALFLIDSPIEYRYWRQVVNDSGYGQISSGNQWAPALGIEIFENFTILHLDGDVDRMIEHNGLKTLDWRKTDERNSQGTATSRH